MRSWNLQGLTAVALVLTTTVVTMPLSAADFSSARPVIGSVSAVGRVDLRGVGISQEGTLFSGDRINSHEKGYAKVLIGTGSKLELNEKTDLNVNRDNRGIQIAMNSGTMGFTAHTPLRIDVAPFEVTASDDASGNVSIMSTTTAGVRAISGKVTIRNMKTSESFVITKGQERLLGLANGVNSPSLGDVAANVPEPVPAPKPGSAPQTPAGRPAGPGLAMDTGAWLAVLGGAAIAGVAIWGLVEAKNNHNDIEQNTAAVKNISNASAIANTAAQQQAALAAVAALAGQTQLALNAAGQANSANAALASSLSAQANANAAQLAALQAQIQAAQAALATGHGNAADLQGLLAKEEQLRTTTNSLIAQLNTLLGNTKNVPGVPQTTVTTIAPPAQSSASVPA